MQYLKDHDEKKALVFCVAPSGSCLLFVSTSSHKYSVICGATMYGTTHRKTYRIQASVNEMSCLFDLSSLKNLDGYYKTIIFYAGLFRGYYLINVVKYAMHVFQNNGYNLSLYILCV